LACADDIDIIARSSIALMEAFLSLERAAGAMGLMIKKEKTKYMTTRINKHQPKHFQIERFNFETVQSFTHLGSLLDVNNDNSVEIRKIILLANKCFCGLKIQFRCQFFIHRKQSKII
jgi:hypothetical protein